MKKFSNTADPEFLEALRLCMNYGFVTDKDIIEWADNYIMLISNPERIILEISACNDDARGIDLLLNEYTGDVKSAYSGRIVLSLFNQKLINGEMNEEQVAEEIYKISLLTGMGQETDEQSAIALPQMDSGLCYPFSHNIYLAKIGITGNLDEIKKKVRSLLSAYAPYTLDNFQDWKSIHTEVDAVLKSLNI